MLGRFSYLHFEPERIGNRPGRIFLLTMSSESGNIDWRQGFESDDPESYRLKLREALVQGVAKAFELGMGPMSSWVFPRQIMLGL
jgi:hypothetical protein